MLIDRYATRRGEARPAAKMTAAKVRWMRWRRDNWVPRPTIAQLAAEFGLSKATVCAILDRRYWKHV